MFCLYNLIFSKNMGAKFFRSADKPKKIRKRWSQTRSWFRTFKWTACKYKKA